MPLENGLCLKKYLLSSFLVNTPSKKGHVHELVSLRQTDDKIFQVYTESLKKFNPNYFLENPISPIAHTKLWNVSTSTLGLVAYNGKAWKFWTPNHFEK